MSRKDTYGTICELKAASGTICEPKVVGMIYVLWNAYVFLAIFPVVTLMSTYFTQQTRTLKNRIILNGNVQKGWNEKMRWKEKVSFKKWIVQYKMQTDGYGFRKKKIEKDWKIYKKSYKYSREKSI